MTSSTDPQEPTSSKSAQDEHLADAASSEHEQTTTSRAGSGGAGLKVRSGRAAIGKLLDWSSDRRERFRAEHREPPSPDADCSDEPGDRCAVSKWAKGPEQTVHFFQLLPFFPLTIKPGDPVEQIPSATFGCTGFAKDGLTSHLAIKADYEQRWFFQDTLVGALSASVALAPGEAVSLTVRSTQRKQFDQETIDEVERSEQTESTTADKEAVNVTRSSSKTNNWTVAGNASVSLGGGSSVGANASMSETINEASQSSAQRTHDSTQKSASNLKTLHKVQVRQTTETTREDTTVRRITNPYRDRSLRLDVYEMIKDYCVEFHLTRLAPSLVLSINRFQFDKFFVTSNAPFLFEELTDRSLESELSEALRLVTDLIIPENANRAEEIALLALDYLYSGHVIFNLPTNFFSPGGVSPIDLNDPAQSFQHPGFGDIMPDGLVEAVTYKLSVIFSTLALYYQLYKTKVLTAPPDRRLAVELAFSLDQLLASKWIGIDETGEMGKVSDFQGVTEIFRRLGGFLTMTSGILKPLLAPAEEERESRREAERAEFVIGRVVDHLTCHARYYTERYLNHVARQTRNRDIAQFVEDVVTKYLIGVPVRALELFDAEAAFIDGSQIVVPLRTEPSTEELNALLEQFDQRPVEVEIGLIDRLRVAVPTDGQHVEGIPGHCVLTNMSTDQKYEPIHVVIEQGV